ncbi:transcriptional adapter ADA2b isoform X4 [Abrus precatorius]|uniref:Transcriptional adapter n=1 Tax=Abrus precatorius TaxID=3816 RepID=A0A8B8M1B2_ABRPR|nr:transcriptional adapter ADA2b isoform X4 [Abrus precatorius]
MGRSRGNFHHADEDPNQRSRRKKNSVSGENSESGAAGQGTSEGKRALYHCNYCNKDITGKIRIKCAMCPDFDLCIECFSVGAEVTPHKSNHPYRVMDNLSFPLICPDWNADDEILLLEGIEMYGLGNWTEVAEHVGTKNKESCIEHYRNVYLNSPFFPLPDMTHVVGKNRKELLAMAKGQGEDKKGISMGDLSLKEDSPFSPSRVKVEDSHKADRDFGGKKPTSSGNEGPSLVESSGYNSKRQEFDPEYDNDAEQLLAEMEFKDTDTEEERELKLRVLRFYSKRLDERKRRKDFILERNLLYPNSFEKDLTTEEKTICQKYDFFMRFHTKEEHEELLRTVISEHRTRKRLRELKEARAAGCRNVMEADRYMVQKRRREAEESARRKKESAQVGPSNQGDLSARPAGPATSSSVNEMDVTGYYGADLLSEPEKRLCCELRLPPATYLKMQEQLSLQILAGNVSAKSDAHQLFKIDTMKIDRVYDMLIKKGIALP